MVAFALKEHGVPLVTNDAQRDAFYPAPTLNQRVYNIGSGSIERFTGSGWVADITNISGGIIQSLQDAVTTALTAATAATAASTAATNAANAATAAAAGTVAAAVAAVNAMVPAGGRTVTTLQTYLSNNKKANVLDFGADPTGGTDSSAAVTAAIASLPTGGGEVVFPSGRYKIKVAVTRRNIAFVGESFLRDDTASVQLVPADTNDYVLAVGDGTTLCKGFQLRNLSIDGLGTGKYGLKLNGCAECFYQNVAIQGCTLIQLKITSSAAQATYFQWFDGLSVAAAASASSVGLDVDYGSQYVTSVFMTNFHIANQAGSSFAAVVDKVRLRMTEGWFEIGGGTGVGISFKTTAGTIGTIDGTNIQVDSSSSSDVLLTADANKHLMELFAGPNIVVDGKLTMPAGTTAALTGANGSLQYQTVHLYPQVVGTLSFWYGASVPATYFPASVPTISAFGSGTLQFDNAATGQQILVTPGSGRVSVSYAGVTSLAITNSSAGKTPYLDAPSTGNLRLNPDGGDVEITGSRIVHQSGCKIYSGSGTPEAAVTAPVGSVYQRTNGGAATSFYVKETGSGNTGWVGK